MIEFVYGVECVYSRRAEGCQHPSLIDPLCLSAVSEKSTIVPLKLLRVPHPIYDRLVALRKRKPLEVIRVDSRSVVRIVQLPWSVMVDLHMRHVNSPHDNLAPFHLADEGDRWGVIVHATIHRGDDLPRPGVVSIKFIGNTRYWLFQYPYVVIRFQVELPDETLVSLIYAIALPLISLVNCIMSGFQDVKPVHDALV